MSSSGTTEVGNCVAIWLSGDDLGRKVSLVHSGVLVIGTLRGIDQTLGYKDRPRVMLTVQSDEGWRWIKSVDPECLLTFHEAVSE